MGLIFLMERKEKYEHKNFMWIYVNGSFKIFNFDFCDFEGENIKRRKKNKKNSSYKSCLGS